MSHEQLRLGFDGFELKAEANVPDTAPRPWDLDTKLSVVGKDHPRIDGVDKVTGRARYSYDVRFPNLAYAGILGAPHARARIKGIDTQAAEKLPGVLHVQVLADQVFYAGQPVVGIAAASEEQLDDALAAVKVDFEVLPHVVDVDSARQPNAPQAVPHRGKGNVIQRGRDKQGNAKQVAQAHASADVKLEREYRTQVQTHSCLETHGSVCHWEGDALTCYASTQATFAFQNTLAQALEIKPAKVTVITEHMGGGFGSKFGADAWDVYCARAAKAIGRPCRLMLSRKAEHLIAGNRPDSIQRCTFSASKDGKLLGAEVHTWGTGGVAPNASVTNPAVYAFKATHSDQHHVLTNAGAGRAFRAPSHPQGFFALEGMLDELAAELGMDPLELRRKNDPHPVRQKQYEIGAEAIGWDRRKADGANPGPLKRGLGVAAARWKHNGRPGCSVRCRIGKDGSVFVASGAQDIGTGTRTVLALMVAEELGLKPSEIEVRIGHTTDPYGHGSGGSVTAPSIGPVARQAAYEAKTQLLRAVAERLEQKPEALELKGGQLIGGDKPLSFAKACALLPVDAVEATGVGTRELFSMPRFAPEVAGVQFAEVEVDVETGLVRVLKVVAVQDCGLVADPLLARSQINGAVIQGVSYALFEQRHLDPKTGAMLNPNLLDYKIVGALDVPEIVSIPFTVANGISTTSMSSLGEPPAVPTAGAIGNAVANAIGARVRSLPITPDKVLAALGEV